MHNGSAAPTMELLRQDDERGSEAQNVTPPPQIDPNIPLEEIRAAVAKRDVARKNLVGRLAIRAEAIAAMMPDGEMLTVDMMGAFRKYIFVEYSGSTHLGLIAAHPFFPDLTEIAMLGAGTPPTSVYRGMSLRKPSDTEWVYFGYDYAVLAVEVIKLTEDHTRKMTVLADELE